MSIKVDQKTFQMKSENGDWESSVPSWAQGGKQYGPATDTNLGLVRVKKRTTEMSEVAIDPKTGKLYVPSIPEEAAGGLQTVATIQERDSIPANRRKAGMKVYVVDSMKYYKLLPDLTTFEEDNGFDPSESFAQLETENKTLLGAVNETYHSQGDLSLLKTDWKSSFVGAVNELYNPVQPYSTFKLDYQETFSGNIKDIIRKYYAYNDVVLGDHLFDRAGQKTFFAEVIRQIKQVNTDLRFYFYIAGGNRITVANDRCLNEELLRGCLDYVKSYGDGVFDGIFIDEFDSSFGNYRKRQNEWYDVIHEYGYRVISNGVATSIYPPVKIQTVQIPVMKLVTEGASSVNNMLTLPFLEEIAVGDRLELFEKKKDGSYAQLYQRDNCPTRYFTVREVIKQQNDYVLKLSGSSIKSFQIAGQIFSNIKVMKFTGETEQTVYTYAETEQGAFAHLNSDDFFLFENPCGNFGEGKHIWNNGLANVWNYYNKPEDILGGRTYYEYYNGTCGISQTYTSKPQAGLDESASFANMLYIAHIAVACPALDVQSNIRSRDYSFLKNQRTSLMLPYNNQKNCRWLTNALNGTILEFIYLPQHDPPYINAHIHTCTTMQEALTARDQYSDDIPTKGTFQEGQIIRRFRPAIGKSLGWICTKSGTLQEDPMNPDGTQITVRELKKGGNGYLSLSSINGLHIGQYLTFSDNPESEYQIIGTLRDYEKEDYGILTHHDLCEVKTGAVLHFVKPLFAPLPDVGGNSSVINVSNLASTKFWCNSMEEAEQIVDFDQNTIYFMY